MRKIASLRFDVLVAFFVLVFGLFTYQAKADICKMVYAGTNYTPTQKPKISVGASPVMTVFGQWVDICTRVSCSGTGVSVSKSSPHGDMDGCKTSIVLLFSVGTTAATGDRTVTIYGSMAGVETVTGTFKITITPAYCNTPEGVLNMMAAPVATSPSSAYFSNVDKFHFSFSSLLFNTPQEEFTNLICQDNVSFTLYYSTSATALSGLDAMAANDNVEVLVLPATSPIKSVTVRATRVGNQFACNATIDRALLSNTSYFYRIGKRISKDGEQDPYVFSATHTFTVSASNVPTTGGSGTTPMPDLVPMGISRPLYSKMGANLGDGTFTYYRLEESFCTSLPTLAAYTQVGTLPNAQFPGYADSNRRIMRLTYALPPMTINFKNNGSAAAGAFQVQAFLGSTNTVLASGNIPSLAAGASGTINYNTRGTAVVYRFPGFDGSTDMRMCYVREELDHTVPLNMETGGITVKVDTGNTVNEGINESNNTRNYTQP